LQYSVAKRRLFGEKAALCSSYERYAIVGSKAETYLKVLASDENVMKVLRVLEKHPELSQRQLAEALGVSLGKTHYILSSLIDVGLVKVDNFKRSDNKLGYMYLLTPRGFVEKAKVTKRFLSRKQREYKALEQQIADLTKEVESMSSDARSR
jgi:MarR family transcriptional regulator, temperature-dependent positive regulator of motility